MTNSLRSLTYASRVSDAMSDTEFTQLGLEAGRLNALDGITGLLVFNGERFCQTIEGAPAAIDDLLTRLHRDPRHTDLIILSDEAASERRFRSWDMQLLSVSRDRQAALDLARQRFEADADFAARATIYRTVEGAFA